MVTSFISDLEIPDSNEVRPEESISQQSILIDDNSSFTITDGSLAVPDYSTISASYSRVRHSHIWNVENGKEYRDNTGKVRWRCVRCK